MKKAYKKKIIIFRTDRLGDYIIHSRPIYELKKKENAEIIIVCSKTNIEIIKKSNFVDKVISYNKDDALFTKIKKFFEIIKYKYYASIVLDGKSFSYFCNIFIRSEKKLGIVYKKIKKIFNFEIYFLRSGRIYNYFFFDKIVFFTSKLSLKKIENLCSLYLTLFNEFGLSLTPKDKYIFENFKKYEDEFLILNQKLNLNNYLLIHLDEKWTDIQNIETNLLDGILNLQKKINKKILISSFNNNHNYYKNLKKNFNNIDANIYSLSNNENIFIYENSGIFLFEKLIDRSFCAISCHSGFLVQVSGANKSNIIDIINEKDFIWYSCWKPLNTKHKFIFKSINNNKRNLNVIINEISVYLEKEIHL